MPAPPKPRFFEEPADLRAWLQGHHDTVEDLWVGFRKKGRGRKSVTYPEALDEALCFGWIDGVRRALDPTSYAIRFTPRKARSFWSPVNVARALELERLGRMAAAGLAAFARRDRSRTERYSYERETGRLAEADEKAFRANRKAWAFFDDQPPWYRKTMTWWVVSAKKEETRRRRLEELIGLSAKGEWHPLVASKRPKGSRRATPGGSRRR